MRRKMLAPLIFIVLLAAVSLGAVLVTDTSPQLGLDLQGGVSVVLEPTQEASDDALAQTIEIIRSRVDALGGAEPEIPRQGSAVVVQPPATTKQQIPKPPPRNAARTARRDAPPNRSRARGHADDEGRSRRGGKPVHGLGVNVAMQHQFGAMPF